MKGTKWRNKAQENLLLKSIEKSDHLRAAKEWEFSGKVIDHEVTDRRCELCEGDNLRYRFEIKNKLNKNELMVGSTCITKFDITVWDDQGNEVFGRSRKTTFLNKEIEKKKREFVLNALRGIWKKSKGGARDEVESLGKIYKEGKALSPGHAIRLIKILQRNDVKIPLSSIKVGLRDHYSIFQALSLNKEDQLLLLMFLSSPQKKRLIEAIENYRKIIEVEQEQDRELDNRVIEKYRNRVSQSGQPLSFTCGIHDHLRQVLEAALFLRLPGADL